MSDVVVTTGRGGNRYHRPTCKKINPANVITEARPLFDATLAPATCCKPTQAMLAEAKLAAAPEATAAAPATKVRAPVGKRLTDPTEQRTVLAALVEAGVKPSAMQRKLREQGYAASSSWMKPILRELGAIAS
jgi:hypothetical protein